MIEIKKYESFDKSSWNQFLEKSRVDSFLFDRNFMEYHSDRFEDCSFLIYRKGNIEGLLPGNIKSEVFYSHQGLTYGGLITSYKFSTIEVMEVFSLVNEYLKSIGIKRVVYKATPYIYHTIPSQEDIYALFRLGAKKIGCNISTAIFQNNRLPFTELRRRGIKKAKKEQVSISEESNPYSFWEILEYNLLKTYGVSPVHSIDEILLLKNRFNNNIRFFNAVIGDEVVAGCVLFIMKNIVHVQYISANEKGKMLGALDLLFDELINKHFADYQIFDFGQSTEMMGEVLNEGLIFQKEGFGGRGIVYDIYEYEL